MINAIRDGWKVKIINNKMEFTKSLSNFDKKIDNSHLNKFIKKNMKIVNFN